MAAEDIYRYLIDNQDFVVFHLDPNGILNYISPGVERFAGYAAAEFTGKPFLHFIHPEDLVELQARFQDALVGTPGWAEFRAIHKDGSIFWVRASSRPHIAQDRPQGVIGIMTDITERKRVEDALRQSEDRYRDLVEHSQDLLCTHSLAGKLLWINPAPARVLGYSVEELVGIPMREVIAPEFRPQFDGYLVQIAKTKAVSGLMTVMARSGERRIWEFHNSLRTEGVAEPIVRGIAHDVTDRIRAEQALRKSEERFRVAIKHSPITVFNQDTELRYTWVHNPKFAWAEQDCTGKTDNDILGEEEAAGLNVMKRQVLTNAVGIRSEVSGAFRGKRFYWDLTVEPLFDSAGSLIGITGASMDISELREKTEQLAELSKRLTGEKLYLENEIEAEHHFKEIVGESTALKRTLADASVVAGTDSTVLILGETGTGKELVARAIHRLSTRKNNSFIKLNCAAIPTGLLESELFGHERGSFTGAVSQKIGRLELADKGTLFLDEVGDIPRELQPKLLRVLQDQEFERLGSTKTLRVDVRLLAATNRDLSRIVAEKQFRSDLFYRLNVFPIRVPALRERKEDIPALVRHFTKKYAEHMKRQIDTIRSEAMNALIAWDWPGNVRELENFVERSVILSDGPILNLPLAELQGQSAVLEAQESAEREQIVRVLRECRGVIAGPNGAAARLGLKRTTLQSKMQRLRISRDEYEGHEESNDSGSAA